MSGFEKHENYVLDQNYNFKWNNQKMLDVLKFIGNNKECEDFELSLLQYEQDPSLKANINKKQSTKQTNKAKYTCRFSSKVIFGFFFNTKQ